MTARNPASSCFRVSQCNTAWAARMEPPETAVMIFSSPSARYCYLRWGALGKAQQLDQRYPAISEQLSGRPATTIGAPVDQLDLRTVVKISQAVSGEIVLEKLIETLMTIAVEHAG
jgi:hypothetical protein